MPTPNEMLVPWLIQRATFRTSPSLDRKEPVDRIVEFDYMGASEYEWGAIGKSLSRMRAQAGSYRMAQVMDPETMVDIENVFGQRLMLYCRNDQRLQIVGHIMMLKQGKYRLKEPSYFESQFDPKSMPISIAQIKKTMTSLGSRRGERVYQDGNHNTYYIDSKTKKIRGPNDYRLRINLWWDIGHDWLMFFETDGRTKKVLESLEPKVETVSQG